MNTDEHWGNEGGNSVTVQPHSQTLVSLPFPVQIIKYPNQKSLVFKEPTQSERHKREAHINTC